MPKIIFISGACGSGKSTFADALARHLVRQDHRTVYVIHGDVVVYLHFCNDFNL